MLRIALVLLTSLLLAACGDDAKNAPEAGAQSVRAGGAGATSPRAADTAASSGLKTPADWPSAKERRLTPDAEPSPFSAKQIAAGSGPDSRRVYRFEIPGQDAAFKLWTFHDQSAEGAVFEQSDCDAAGVATGEATEKKVTWAELQSHASWPAASTTATEAQMRVPAGDYACMHYVVTRKGTRGSGEDKYWFAWALPGPPVRMERYVNGRLMLTMTLMRVQGVN